MYAERVIFFYINRAFQSTLSISKRPCIQLYMVEMLRIPLQDLIHLYLGKLARTIHMNYARNSIVLCMPVISHYARAYTCTGMTKYVNSNSDFVLDRTGFALEIHWIQT